MNCSTYSSNPLLYFYGSQISWLKLCSGVRRNLVEVFISYLTRELDCVKNSSKKIRYVDRLLISTSSQCIAFYYINIQNLEHIYRNKVGGLKKSQTQYKLVLFLKKALATGMLSKSLIQKQKIVSDVLITRNFVHRKIFVLNNFHLSVIIPCSRLFNKLQKRK